MFTTVDQVEFYADRSYDPSASAQHLFSTNGEIEVGNKLKQMNSLLGNIEAVLKQEVRDNYNLLLKANVEITRVGMDMTELQRLVDGCKKFIDEIRECRSSQINDLSKSTLTNKIQLKLQKLISSTQSSNLPSEELYRTIMKDTFSTFGNIEESALTPEWLLKSPDNLANQMIEHEYENAVDIVIRSRKYQKAEKESLPKSFLESPNQELYDIIDNKAKHLAESLRSSLPYLANSSLWGLDELKNRLGLLLLLGEYTVAVEGFFQSHLQVLSKSINNTGSSGDILNYITDLTQLFFEEVMGTCQSFLELFGTYSEDSKVLTLLLKWTHSQLAAFMATIGKQINLGKNEYSTQSIIHLRSLMSARGKTGADSCGDDSSSAGDGSDEGSDEIEIRESDEVEEIEKSDDNNKCRSPLSFASKCFNIAYIGATRADVIGLQAGSFLCYTAITEIEKIIISYVDDLIHELQSQIRQDQWMPFQRTSKNMAIQDEKQFVSSSYVWLNNAFILYFKELSIFLHSDISNLDDSKDLDQVLYQRYDVCEIEPIAIANFLRLIVSYVMEVELLQTSMLSPEQLYCFSCNMQSVVTFLIPSIENKLNSGYIIDGFLLDANPPIKILASLSIRLLELQESLTKD